MLSEKLHFAKGLAPAADRFNTNPPTDVYNLGLAEDITFIVAHAGGTTGKATITVEACDDVTPSNTTAIPFRYRRMTTGADDTMGDISVATAAGIDTVPTEDTLIEINVRASELTAGKPFVRLKLTEAVNDPVVGFVLAILGNPRYQGETQPSVLA